MVKLRNIDLNLLVIVDALLDEAHVGRAAIRLNLTQPATSNALARARALFDDPLLVKVDARGMRLTPRAKALQVPLRRALADMSTIMEPTPVPIGEAEGTVRILAPDTATVTTSPDFMRLLTERAPGIDLVFHPWHAGDEITRLQSGEVDLVVSADRPFPASLRAQSLGRFPYTVFTRPQHSLLAGGADLEPWLASRHVIVSGQGNIQGPIDSALAAIGRRRRVAVVVPTFAQALELIRTTDLVGTFPDNAGWSSLHPQLVRHPPPFDIDAIGLSLVRHRRTDADRAILLVEDLIASLREWATGSASHTAAQRL